MALIKCPECGKEISDAVKTCPNCGYPILKVKKEFPIKIVGIALIILLIFGSTLFIFCNKLNDSEQKKVDYVITSIENIGKIDIKNDSKITEAEKLYGALSKKCQHYVGNYKELSKARDTYNNLKAQETSGLIDQIGNVALNSQKSIDKAKKSYDDLSEEQKKLVGNSKYLTSAIEQISNLKINNAKSKISAIGMVTLESADKIKAARTVYNELSNDDKLKIENYNELANAENEYEHLSVNNCISLINSIGTVTLDSKSKIEEAQRAYNSLSKESKEKILDYSILADANANCTKLEKEEEDRKKTLNPGESFSTSKWEVTYTKANITAKILPNNTNSYYKYYRADDDDIYIDIIFQVKNIDTAILGIENMVGNCEVEYDGTTITKKYGLLTSTGSQIDKVYSWDGLDALDSITLHVAIPMPRELKTNGKTIAVKLVIAGEEKLIHVR